MARVDLQVQRVIGDDAEHQAVVEQAVGAEHAPHLHLAELGEQVGEMLRELAHRRDAASCA